jgi:hypothetical protein
MDQIKLYARLPAKDLKKQLMKGSFLGALACLLLLSVGIYLPPWIFKDYGWALFLSFLLPISYGLIPYRKLAVMQEKGGELLLNSYGLSYFVSKEKIFTASWEAIEEITTYKDKKAFGINLCFKENRELGHLEIFEPFFKIQRQKSTLRIPYFSQQDVEELNEVWKSEMHNYL